MENKIKKAPDILTGKDLDYLKDIFGWNYTLYKLGENSIESINDQEIVKFIKECNDFFYNNLTIILNILKEEHQNEK